jgi:hypothetical protein
MLPIESEPGFPFGIWETGDGNLFFPRWRGGGGRWFMGEGLVWHKDSILGGRCASPLSRGNRKLLTLMAQRRGLSRARIAGGGFARGR